MKIWMEKTLKRFGRPVVVRSAEGAVRVHGIFQSVNSRSWQNMEHVFSPLGRIPRGQYLCMLSAGTAARIGDSIIVENIEHEIRKLENMYLGSDCVYIWCLCVEKGA